VLLYSAAKDTFIPLSQILRIDPVDKGAIGSEYMAKLIDGQETYPMSRDEIFRNTREHIFPNHDPNLYVITPTNGCVTELQYFRVIAWRIDSEGYAYAICGEKRDLGNHLIFRRDTACCFMPDGKILRGEEAAIAYFRDLQRELEDLSETSQTTASVNHHDTPPAPRGQ